MAVRKTGKLNQLEQALPEGLLVDAAWLTAHGYSTSLRNQYVASGWLEQPARGVYRRPRGSLSWQQVVLSLQTILLRQPLIVGGRTALELQGFTHYLTRETKEVHLYGPKPPPGWLAKLPLDVQFIYHSSNVLFLNEPVTLGLSSLGYDVSHPGVSKDAALSDGLIRLPWGQWDWPLTLSSPERAVLELLNQLPADESFHQVDMLFEGLSTLSPRRLQKLLLDCRSIKVKRLFFFFANRHPHAWVKRLDRARIDLGTGKRMLVPGGRLDPDTQITVPKDFHGVR